MDRYTIESIRGACGVDRVNDWVLKRRKERDEHIYRTEEERVVRIVRDRSPRARRSMGRSRKSLNQRREERIPMNTYVFLG